jgi:protein phosphatase
VRIVVPELSFVILVGPSGSGKSTFARRHFKPTEILSSDGYRGLVSDDENDQTATEAAFDALYYIPRKRLVRGRLTVLDATNVLPESRKNAIALAREFERLPIAIVFNLPEHVCNERNGTRTDRDWNPYLASTQRQQFLRG